MGLTAEKAVVIASIAPATNAEAVASRAEVPEGISVVEIRLDGFAEEPDLAALRDTYAAKSLVATVRSASEGGRYLGDRAGVEKALRAALKAGFDLVDVEYQAGQGKDLLGLDPNRVIVSSHDLAGIPADLENLLDGMQRTGARFVKIVGTAHDSRDALRLLAFQRRRADGRLAAFAMGEPGIATRILSTYLGSPLAYGSLGEGRETAPGQVPAADLVEVYGVGRSRNVEKLYALFGGYVSHSLSPALHNATFEALKVPALYVPFALKSMLTEFDPLVVAFDGFGLRLKGASVTIPFKEEAATVAVFRGESVANTLVRSGDAYIASNTDRTAIASFTPLAIPGTRALVLGAGGTARTAVDVLTSRRYDVSIFSREPVRAHELCEEVGGNFLSKLDPRDEPFPLVVNATPLGMKADDPLPCPETFFDENVILIDAPYRRGGTPLARIARDRGATVYDGLALLVAQAAKQAELFTSRPTTPSDLLSRLGARHRSLFEVNA